MLISIIIPTKDRNEILYETLHNAVNAIGQIDAEIIVVNDSKTAYPIIPDKYMKVRLINNPKSGVASARNIGAKEATGKLLLFLDDDIIISKDSIQHILKVHEQNEKLCLNLNWEYPEILQDKLGLTQFGRFMKAHGLTTFKGWYSDSSWQDDALFPSKAVASFHLSISRSNFFKTKGYNEEFPHAGFEDYDFPLQLKRAGFQFFIDSRVTVYHNEADRFSLENWFRNQRRRAQTRRMAVDLGYLELELKYNFVKRTILTFLSETSTFAMNLLRIIPNKKMVDPLYFRLLSAMQASQIYKGYTSNKLQ